MDITNSNTENNLIQFWKDEWQRNSESENIFSQMGRNSYSLVDYFLMLKDVVDVLQFQKTDCFLDAGGGAGYLSMSVSPYVKKSVIYDYTISLVEQAKKLCQNFGNINAYHVDLLSDTAYPDDTFDKILAGSIIHYFGNIENIRKFSQKLFDVLRPNGKIIFVHNPNTEKYDAFMHSFDALDWSQEKKERSKQKYDLQLWTTPQQLAAIGKQCGFKKCYESPINPQLFQSKYMYNFVFEK